MSEKDEKKSHLLKKKCLNSNYGVIAIVGLLSVFA